jgi:glycosyltransferase involved in cell wall biosynthesis
MDPAQPRSSGPPRPTGLRIAMVGQGMHPIPAPGYAPVEKHIASLLRALRERGEDVHLVNRVLPRFRFRLLVHALWVSRQLRRLRPDVIHCHSPINAWMLRRLGHRRIVFTSHSREWVRSTLPGYRPTPELRNHRRGLQASDARIVLSGQVRAAVAQLGLGGPPCQVIPNGVDASRYTLPGSPRRKRLLVGVGVVARVKRWHLVAQAIQGTDWSLEVVGPVNQPDYAEEILSAGPRVRLRGEVAEGDVLDALHRARVIIHPSEAEAMSLAVLEGMATGLPVLGSQALGDVVQDGVQGFLVPEGPPLQQVEAYRSVLAATPEAQWAAMGSAARDTALAGFTWDAVAARTCQVYQQLAKQG